MQVTIGKNQYHLQVDKSDYFVINPYEVAFCDGLAKTYMPLILDSSGHGSSPSPPEFIAYRILIDTTKPRLCILYEVYWKRQDCTWRELNKDHDHDYEAIQLHFNLETGAIEKIAIAAGGPIEYAGHGVELYTPTTKAESRSSQGLTSPKNAFPWGQYAIEIQILEQPMSNLAFQNQRPVILIVNCYHVFTGLKVWHLSESQEEIMHALEIPLKRLDLALLEHWYYRNVNNRFGHDLSNPFTEPYLKYYPPPEDLKSRIAYGFLWIYHTLKRLILGQ
ncbi:MAG: hypothetical protein ACFFCH_10960 [Promethearchaeota archaeon]